MTRAVWPAAAAPGLGGEAAVVLVAVVVAVAVAHCLTLASCLVRRPDKSHRRITPSDCLFVSWKGWWLVCQSGAWLVSQMGKQRQ